jgi:hypothetical protein
MKKLKQHFLITSLVSISIYLITSFIAWDLTVITRLPEIAPEFRAMWAALIVCVHATVGLINSDH